MTSMLTVGIRRLAEGASGADDSWYSNAKSAAGVGGVPVTTDSLLTLSAFFAAVTIIGETIGTVPLDLFERIDQQGQPSKRPAPELPFYDVLHNRPNDHQTAAEYREFVTAVALLRGRCVSEIIPGPRGPVDQLVPLAPDLVTRKQQAGEGVWEYRDPKLGGRTRVLGPDQTFVLNGRLGKGLLDVAKDNASTSLAMQRHQGFLFSRGARHQGVIRHPNKLGPTARENLQKEITKFSISGQYSGRPMLLEDGMTWENAGFSDRESQLADLLRMTTLDAARFTRIPPTKLAELGDATFSNVEELGIEFVTDCIRPWAVRWEQAILMQLILPGAPFFAEHNLEGLLRGDIASRYAAYEIAIRNRWMTRNEVRARENLTPILGGNEFDAFPTTGGVPQPAAVTGYLRLMARDAAARLVRKESAALGKLADRTGARGAAWESGLRAFYEEHARETAKLLRMEGPTAQEYAHGQEQRLLAAGALDDEGERINDLTDLALTKVADLQVADSTRVSARNVTPAARSPQTVTTRVDFTYDDAGRVASATETVTTVAA